MDLIWFSLISRSFEKCAFLRRWVGKPFCKELFKKLIESIEILSPFESFQLFFVIVVCLHRFIVVACKNSSLNTSRNVGTALHDWFHCHCEYSRDLDMQSKFSVERLKGFTISLLSFSFFAEKRRKNIDWAYVNMYCRRLTKHEIENMCYQMLLLIFIDFPLRIFFVQIFSIPAVTRKQISVTNKSLYDPSSLFCVAPLDGWDIWH